MENAQEVLIRLSELTREAGEAVRRDDHRRSQELDTEIELKLGEKERTMGALQEHEKEHGC